MPRWRINLLKARVGGVTDIPRQRRAHIPAQGATLGSVPDGARLPCARNDGFGASHPPESEGYNARALALHCALP
jgi:hypothetical protein